MDQLDIEQGSTSRADVSLFGLKGPFTLNTMFELQQTLRDLGSQGCIIDLTGVPYMDSAGLGVLLGHFAHSQRVGSKMAIVGISPRVHTIFEITHTDQILPIFPTAREAEVAFANAASA